MNKNKGKDNASNINFTEVDEYGTKVYEYYVRTYVRALHIPVSLIKPISG